MAIQRNTIQKQMVKDALQKLNHPTAGEIYDYVHNENPLVSRATLYRNLRQMSIDGIIKKIETLGGEASRFDVIIKPHYHGKCRGCNKLFDIEMDDGYIVSLKENVKNVNEFVIESEELIFIGLCPKCKHTLKRRKT